MKLHIFNPENDLALANFEHNFIAPRSARVMAADLEMLPYWWASDGDMVCVSDKDSCVSYLSGFPFLQKNISFVTMTECDKTCSVQPWGWSPSLLRHLERSGFTSLSYDAAALTNLRRCASRERAVEILASVTEKIAERYPDYAPYICGKSEFCISEERISSLLSVWPDTILKAPWSGSGKGLRLGRSGYVSPLSGWCRRILSTQGGVVVEPYYNKVYDMAWEFYLDGKGGVDYTGLSLFTTTHQGIYSGNRVAPSFVKEAWLYERIPKELCDILKSVLIEELAEKMHGYTGEAGVDMMLCSDPSSSHLLIHPCVEVNVRRTMGWVACDLESLLADGSEGIFSIDYFKEEGELLSDHEDRKKAMPCITDGSRIVSGYLSLTPVSSDTHYRARLEVTSRNFR